MPEENHNNEESGNYLQENEEAHVTTTKEGRVSIEPSEFLKNEKVIRILKELFSISKEIHGSDLAARH